MEDYQKFYHINHHEILSHEDTLKLIEKIHDGDSKSKELLLKHNMRLILSIVRNYNLFSIQQTDLIQEGVIGFLEAVDRFDFTKDVRLSTYATWWIKSYVEKAINQQCKLIRIPLRLQQQIKKIEYAEKKLKIELNRDCTLDELSKYTDISISKIEKLRDLARPILSLDYTLNQAEHDETLLSYLKDDEERQTENIYEKADFLHELTLSFNCLNDKERCVMQQRYDYAELQPTFKKVGETLNMTRSRCQQIEQKALKKIRKFLAIV